MPVCLSLAVEDQSLRPDSRDVVNAAAVDCIGRTVRCRGGLLSQGRTVALDNQVSTKGLVIVDIDASYAVFSLYCLPPVPTRGCFISRCCCGVEQVRFLTSTDRLHATRRRRSQAPGQPRRSVRRVTDFFFLAAAPPKLSGMLINNG